MEFEGLLYSWGDNIKNYAKYLKNTEQYFYMFFHTHNVQLPQNKTPLCIHSQYTFADNNKQVPLVYFHKPRPLKGVGSSRLPFDFE